MASTEQSITCRVCETVQPNAWYCVTCGLALHAIPSPEWVDPPPEGFEPTHREDVEIDSSPIPGLELTHYEEAPDTGLETIPGLERATETELPVPDAVFVEQVPGLEVTSFPFEKSAEPPPSTKRCEWCGYPQATGRVCDYCGRVRERVLRTVDDGGASLVKVCAACGARGATGLACPVCGEALVTAGGD